METNFSGYSQYSEPGFDPSVSSSATMGLSDEAMASIGSDENQDQSIDENYSSRLNLVIGSDRRITNVFCG